MNYQQVLSLIQQFIVANGNNEITANVLRPILEAILAQPNELIGDLDDLQTDDRANLVAAINSLLDASSAFGGSTKIHSLPLNGVDISQSELSYIAEAVKLHGPFTCEAGQQMVFKTTSTVGTQENGDIVTRYYRLLKNVVTIGGGGGTIEETQVLPSWFMPDGEGMYENPEDEGIIAELGNIGTDNVWDAFNLGDAGEAWDMELYRFVRATQNGEIKLWAFTGLERFYGGTDMGIEPDIYEAFERDFFLITDQPQTPSSDFRILPYEFIIDEMLTDQANQSEQNIIFVEKAHEDPSLNFPQGETRTYAYYQLRSDSTKTGSLSDYRLISAPWANVGGGIDFTTDESLYLDPLTNELRQNVSDFSEKYTYASGVQEFELISTPTKIIYISVNGQLLEDPLTQWSIDVPTKTITILDELEMGDRVTIHYQYFITT